MKVWYDAHSIRDLKFGCALSKELKRCGHEFIFTALDCPEALSQAGLYGEKPKAIGKPSSDSLISGLQANAQRIIEFCKLFEDNNPDVAITPQSAEVVRTAYGLGIPIILTADKLDADALNRLTIPFAHTAVVSEALPKRFPKTYCAQRVVRFKGVDEVAWIESSKSHSASASKKPLIIYDQSTSQAEKNRALAEKLAEIGEVYLLGQGNSVESSAALVSKADLVVSYGGSVCREAALQGVPSVAISDAAKAPLNTYLAKKGFPLFITAESRVMELAKKYLGRRFDVAEQLAGLENPVKVIADLVDGFKKS